MSDRVWDLFFLKGPKVIFSISLALLHLMKKDLLKCKDFAEIFETLESYPRKVIDVNTLIQTSEIPKYKIKATFIKDARVEMREKVESQLQSLVQVKENFKGTY